MGRDHSIECPLCELNYGGLGSDDTDCPDCGRLALVRDSEWMRVKAERDALRALVGELVEALYRLEKHHDPEHRCFDDLIARARAMLGGDASLSGSEG